MIGKQQTKYFQPNPLCYLLDTQIRPKHMIYHHLDMLLGIHSRKWPHLEPNLQRVLGE